MWCTRSCIGFGLSVILFSLSRNIYMGIALVAPRKLLRGHMHHITCNTLLQSMVPISSRSRITSLYTLAILGVLTFGSLMSGQMGDLLGTEWLCLYAESAIQYQHITLREKSIPWIIR
ncbi:MAG: hypothetical protein RR214_01245 [Synergistaceae bacterium]